jgi:hypothetical protein
MKLRNNKHELETLELISNAESVHRQAREAYILFEGYQSLAREYLNHKGLKEESLNKFQKMRLQACRDESRMLVNIINAADEIIDAHGDEKLLDRYDTD